MVPLLLVLASALAEEANTTTAPSHGHAAPTNSTRAPAPAPPPPDLVYDNQIGLGIIAITAFATPVRLRQPFPAEPPVRTSFYAA